MLAINLLPWRAYRRSQRQQRLRLIYLGVSCGLGIVLVGMAVWLFYLVRDKTQRIEQLTVRYAALREMTQPLQPSLNVAPLDHSRQEEVQRLVTWLLASPPAITRFLLKSQGADGWLLTGDTVSYPAFMTWLKAGHAHDVGFRIELGELTQLVKASGYHFRLVIKQASGEGAYGH